MNPRLQSLPEQCKEHGAEGAAAPHPSCSVLRLAFLICIVVANALEYYRFSNGLSVICCMGAQHLSEELLTMDVNLLLCIYISSCDALTAACVQAARSGVEVGAARADRIEAVQPEVQSSLPQADVRSAAHCLVAEYEVEDYLPCGEDQPFCVWSLPCESKAVTIQQE